MGIRSLLMENLLRSKKYWSVIKRSYEEPGDAIDKSILKTITQKETANQLWDSIKVKYQGNAKRAQLLRFREEFDSLLWKSDGYYKRYDKFWRRHGRYVLRMDRHMGGSADGSSTSGSADGSLGSGSKPTQDWALPWPVIDRVFPISVPLYTGGVLEKDSAPHLTARQEQAVQVFSSNKAPFRRYPECFLALVGLSPYYPFGENTYPAFEGPDRTGG
ncbi:hypothetical protein Tco_1358000 [Tanacetum coccineum]